jgi:matrixin
MTKLHRGIRSLALAVALLPSVTLALPANAACQGPGALEASTLPLVIPPGECSLVGALIRDHGVGVVVPPPGGGAYGDLLTTAGSEALRIETSDDGTVRLFNVGSESIPIQLGGVESEQAEPGEKVGSPSGCNDATEPPVYAVESDPRLWFFNRASAPTDLAGFTDAETAIRYGTTNILTENNNCGFSDAMNGSAKYLGNTSKRAEMDAQGNCQGFLARDGANVVDFGDLPVNGTVITLGTACVWYYSAIGEISEADVRLNKVDAKWTTSPGTNCSNRYDVESVATHEVGHAYGMDHVSESTHANLTMSTNINGPCELSERTLGWGSWSILSTYY